MSKMDHKFSKKLVIGITGMPGAEKTKVAQLLSNYGIPYLTLSNVLREELKMRKLSFTPANYEKLAIELRKEFGKDIIAKKCWDFIEKNIDSEVIIVDGLRSPEEVSFFKKVIKNFFLVLVHASPHTRFDRLNRKDPVNFNSREKFDLLEKHNLKLGIGEVISQADYVIVNEDYIGLSLEKQVEMLYRFLKSRYPKINWRKLK